MKFISQPKVSVNVDCFLRLIAHTDNNMIGCINHKTRSEDFKNSTHTKWLTKTFLIILVRNYGYGVSTALI